jgi:flagellar motor component MotA
MNRSGIAGICFFVLLIGSACFSGASLFINIPSALICVGMPAALGIMSYGMPDFMRGIWAIRALIFKTPPGEVSARETSVLRGLIAPVYASGLIGTVIGVMLGLAHLDDPSHIGPALALSLLCMFYSVLIAEGIIRPAARLIDHNQPDDHSRPAELTEPEAETEIAQ